MPEIHIAFADETLDARCAAAIVRRWAITTGTRRHLYPLRADDRNDDQAAPLDARILRRLYPPSQQRALAGMAPDHDPSQHAIYVLGDLESGVRLPEHAALAELGNVQYLSSGTEASVGETAWARFFSPRTAPLCVGLLGRYQMGYDLDEELWCEEILPFQYAMRAVETDPGTDDGALEWQRLFGVLTGTHTRKRIKDGMVIIRYLQACGETLERPSQGAPISRMTRRLTDTLFQSSPGED